MSKDLDTRVNSLTAEQQRAIRTLGVLMQRERSSRFNHLLSNYGVPPYVAEEYLRRERRTDLTIKAVLAGIVVGAGVALGIYQVVSDVKKSPQETQIHYSPAVTDSEPRTDSPQK